ncbi:MAG: HAD-IA family hydrolase [Candidatus Woesearchaeota archaeon]|jgi:phosphoglycolate phosphatase
MIKLIIFDYDGVIVDSFANVHKVYQILCKKLGRTCPTDLEYFRNVYGYSSYECYNNLGFSEDEMIKGNEIFREEIKKTTSLLFPEIISVIKELSHNYRLALISSSYKEEVESKLKSFGLFSYFEKVLGREKTEEKYRKREVIPLLLTEMGVTPDQTLMIGDREVDFNGATAAGINSVILVEYGWGYNPKNIPKYQSKYVVKEPRDLLEAVKKF